MKLHITIDQLFELSPEKLNKLQEMWTPMQGDPIVTLGRQQFNFAFHEKSRVYPLINIGQAIQFIIALKPDEFSKIQLTRRKLFEDASACWVVESDKLNYRDTDQELIDVLWGVIKNNI